MFVLLSGEGPSDMGGATAHGAKPGPMAHIVDRFVYEKFDFSPLDSGLVYWVSRSELNRICKDQALRPHTLLPGVKREPGYAGYTKHAAALAWLAVEKEAAEQDACVAVMFRDSDGTRSAANDHWEQTVEAAEMGFRGMEFARGAPMVPKPKQEAWLLCAKKADPYAHCHLLEDESGNDHCPNPLKEQLAVACGGDPTTEDMCEWIVDGHVDLGRINMPSFDRFKASLRAALDAVPGP